jgi:2'-5' RNA ligase
VPTPAGIFILGELTGPVADEIQRIIERHDPKLARARRPHVTLAGSSGLGPIAASTTAVELRSALEPVAIDTPPLVLELGRPERFPGTEIVVLPIAPRGPIRTLHDRIATSGLHFARPRFAFSPHVTLNLYRTLTRDRLAMLLATRITEPVVLDRLQCYYTSEPNAARLLLELKLEGATPSATSAAQVTGQAK